MRYLLNQISIEQGTTLFLTSHDTADIEQVCERVIVLDKGRVLQDCPLSELRSQYVNKKRITLITDQKELSLDLPGIEVLESQNFVFRGEIDLNAVSIQAVVNAAVKQCSLKDMTIEDPKMEEIIQSMYE